MCPVHVDSPTVLIGRAFGQDEAHADIPPAELCECLMACPALSVKYAEVSCKTNLSIHQLVPPRCRREAAEMPPRGRREAAERPPKGRHHPCAPLVLFTPHALAT